MDKDPKDHAVAGKGQDLQVTREGLEEWERGTLRKALERTPDRGPLSPPQSSIPVNLLYTPLDLEGRDYVQDIGFPGQYPYTRGLYPVGYRSQLWNKQQFAGYGTPEDANKRYKYLREQGQEGYFGRAMVNIAFDLPTIYGHDSDDPVAEGEVGKCGVAIDSLIDMEALLDGFDLQQTFTSMVITGPSIALLAMYIACAERQGVPIEKLSGVMQNDPLKAYIASKFYVFPPRKAVRI
ncbi:MAG: methylmalonyl-CoA mutase family protein, partial [Dehalococcoidia bacterium]|nr:methylmalonyl-CoA mutase family protein [Dehalococcoidia bacterium]